MADMILKVKTLLSIKKKCAETKYCSDCPYSCGMHEINCSGFSTCTIVDFFAGMVPEACSDEWVMKCVGQSTISSDRWEALIEYTKKEVL